MEEKRKTPPELKFAEDMQVIFANMVRVSHTPAELVLDFAQMLPAQDQINVLSRIIMTPMGAKLFFTALRENLARYEASFGEINIPHNSPLVNDLFRSVQPPKNPEDKPQEPQE
jgi:hypothetical protein